MYGPPVGSLPVGGSSSRGGIGLHEALKPPCFTACGFDSHREHVIQSSGMSLKPCAVCRQPIVKGDWYQYVGRKRLIHCDCLADGDMWIQAGAAAMAEQQEAETHPKRAPRKFRRESTSAAGRRAGTG